MRRTTALISIDTNILLRLCVNDEPAQVTAANRCLEAHLNVCVSTIAVLEAMYVMTNIYSFDRQRAVLTLEAILRQPNIICDSELFERAFPHYLEHPKLSLEDCCLAIEAHFKQAVPLYTFDRKLANQLEYTSLLKT